MKINKYGPKKQYLDMNGYKFEERSSYVVELSMGYGNPIFQDILYTGFLNGEYGTPGGYSKFLNNDITFKRVMYLKVISKINTTIPNKHKLMKAVFLSDFPEYIL